MNDFLTAIVSAQLGASIEMLRNAMLACPAEVWSGNGASEFHQFWYIAYHTLFFLDLQLSGPAEGFAPPAPFTLSELDPSGVLPDRVYTKEELLTYLDHCRRKCSAMTEALTEEEARKATPYNGAEFPFAELLLFTMRHVQHHTGQLNLILRQQTDSAPRWVRRG
jgi:hypothetical protein